MISGGGGSSSSSSINNNITNGCTSVTFLHYKSSLLCTTWLCIFKSVMKLVKALLNFLVEISITSRTKHAWSVTVVYIDPPYSVWCSRHFQLQHVLARGEHSEKPRLQWWDTQTHTDTHTRAPAYKDDFLSVYYLIMLLFAKVTLFRRRWQRIGMVRCWNYTVRGKPTYLKENLS